MATAERWLPIFPLNVVLFPKVTIPLQIFEERYKLMMQDCLNDDSKFGVVLIKTGAEVGELAIPYTTGTLVNITQVNRVDRGLMFISIAGLQRFQILNITQYQPYMGAYVKIVEDCFDGEVSPADMEELRLAANRHVNLTLGLKGEWVRESKLPVTPRDLSYFIASMLRAKLPEKQALLEETNTSKRLESELAILRRDGDKLKRRVSREFLSKFGRQ